jgi:hypothetical protein
MNRQFFKEANMNTSTRIFADLQTVLVRIRGLNAEADACQPIRRSWRLSPAEQSENERRQNRLEEIAIELRKASAEAGTLRKRYSDAMALEQAPVLPAAEPVKSSGEIPKLRKQIAECETFLADLPDQRRPHVVAAARGDKKAIVALDLIAAAENSALNKIDVAKAAISEIEMQNAETQREFAERDADEKHKAGLIAADAIVMWAESFDEKLRDLPPTLRSSLISKKHSPSRAPTSTPT